jgi:BlaI family transcriptional regulator, penicillinase repressor
MTPTRPPVSDTELAVLKVLWRSGPGTVREIEGRLRRRKPRWAYNTVLTLLTRLREKGYVASDPRGAAHVFRAVVTRDELLTQDLASLADRICDGTASPLVHALVRGRRLTAEDIAHLRQLLDELEREG